MKQKVKAHLIAALITLAVAAVGFYIVLPAISLRNAEILIDIVILSVIYAAVYARLAHGKKLGAGIKAEIVGEKKHLFKGATLTTKILVGIALVCVLIWGIGNLAGARLFNAARYRELLTVDESGSFTEDVQKIAYDQIPTADYDTATRLGDKQLGTMPEMVSQFRVIDDFYTQINFKGQPVRVTPMEYADVFKWFSNVSHGTPGYILIDMTSLEASVEIVEGGIKYSTADHFGRNLYRHLRFNYPTYMFEEPAFELDENGTPYWVCARYTYKVGLYGGKDIIGAVLVNASTGEHKYYDITEVPTWVDRVYNADLIIEQYDYYGTLQNGFWNSIFGQKGCRVTTDGYNYIADGDDVYMYTGVTSVSSDRSILGFILTNQRTKETSYYAIAGADEESAMSSAEGEVQNLRYTATFPLLLNIDNHPTYFIALKDAAGLVKMYAMVNVQQYQLVAKGQTLEECERNYSKLMTSSGTVAETPESEKKSISGAVQDIRTAVVDGNSRYYIKIEGSDKTFVVAVSTEESVVTLNVGDKVHIEYEETQGVLQSVLSFSIETV